jgi:hypothetical protein
MFLRLENGKLLKIAVKIPIFLLGEPLRHLRWLASGYPLHHLLRHFMASQVVPLLSLSLPRTNAPKCVGARRASPDIGLSNFACDKNLRKYVSMSNDMSIYLLKYVSWANA